jgi:hypothetical protein
VAGGLGAQLMSTQAEIVIIAVLVTVCFLAGPAGPPIKPMIRSIFGDKIFEKDSDDA